MKLVSFAVMMITMMIDVVAVDDVGVFSG